MSNIWTMVEGQTSRLSGVHCFRSYAKISDANMHQRAMAQFPKYLVKVWIGRSVALRRYERAIRGYMGKYRESFRLKQSQHAFHVDSAKRGTENIIALIPTNGIV